MLKRNIVCWFGWHKFVEDKLVAGNQYCQRCGLYLANMPQPVFDQPKGKTQFLEAGTPKERFEEAKNINDLLRDA